MRNALLFAALLLLSAPAFAVCDRASRPGIFVFESDAAVAGFLVRLQKAVAAGNAEQVAGMVRFPVRTSIDGRHGRYGRRAFLKHYAAVIDRNVSYAVAMARFRSRDDHDCVFWNAEGMMLGDGAIWFMQTDDGIRIVAINH